MISSAKIGNFKIKKVRNYTSNILRRNILLMKSKFFEVIYYTGLFDIYKNDNFYLMPPFPLSFTKIRAERQVEII